MSPLCQIFFPHDDPDIPGYARLEIDIDNYSIVVEFDISPPHGPDFTDPKSPLIQHGDDCPIHAAVAGFNHGPDLSGVRRAEAVFVIGSFRGVWSFRSFFSEMNEYSFSISQR